MPQLAGKPGQPGKELFDAFHSDILLEAVGVPDAQDRFVVDAPVILQMAIAGDDIRKALPTLLQTAVRRGKLGG